MSLLTAFGTSPPRRFKTYLFKVICLKNRKIAVLFVSTLHWGHNSMPGFKEDNCFILYSEECKDWVT
jgi:hypothetical protein